MVLGVVLAGAVAATAVAVIHSGREETAGGRSSGTAHQLTGYWQNFASDAGSNLRLRDVPGEYDVVAIAFAVADPGRPGAIEFAVDASLSEALGGYTGEEFSADVKALHSGGRKVVLSVGGESDDVPVRNAAEAGAFAATAGALIARYGFDGIDIDLEHGITPSALAQALRELVKARPELMITMAPQTVDLAPGGTYLTLIQDVRDIVTVVQTQYYNSGSMTGCDGKEYHAGTIDFVTAQACTLLKYLRPEQISLGFPATAASAGRGYLAPAQVNAAMDCLTAQRHCGDFRPPKAAPGLRGVMTWSVNEDAAAGYAFARTVRPHLDSL
jgi:chitinase